MHGITKETYIHNNNLHTCSGCALSSYLETVPETWGLSTFVCNFQIFGSLHKWPPQANPTADQQSNTHTNNTSWVHLVYCTHVEQTFFTCTRSARCSKSLTHSNQCMRHKYVLSWQMASPEGKSHQELMPSMQYTHCRQITNQIIAAVFKKHKYWAALITYYLISASSGICKTDSFWQQRRQDLCSTYMLKYTPIPKGDKRVWTEGSLFKLIQSHTWWGLLVQLKQTPEFHRVWTTGPSTQLLWSAELLLFHWIAY